METSVTFGRKAIKEAKKADKRKESEKAERELVQFVERMTPKQRIAVLILLPVCFGFIGLLIGFFATREEPSDSIAFWIRFGFTCAGLILGAICNIETIIYIIKHQGREAEYEYSEADTRENAKSAKTKKDSDEPTPILVKVGDYLVPLVTAQSRWQDKTVPFGTRHLQSKEDDI